MLPNILKLIILITPLYLVRFSVLNIPTTVLEVSIYTLFLFWLIKGDKSYFKKLDWKIWTPIILVFFGATISTITSDNLIVSSGIWKAYFLDPLLFLIALVSVADLRGSKRGTTRKKTVDDILYYFLASGYVITLISLSYLLIGNLTYDGRLRALYLSPNHLAMFLAPVFLINIYFLMNEYQKRTYGRTYVFRFTGLSIGLIAVGVILFFTASLGAWIGLLTASLVWLLISCKLSVVILNLFQNLRRIVRLLTISYGVLVAGWLLARLPSIANYIDSTGQSSLHSRIMIWESAAKILSNNLILGIGPGMFQTHYLNYQQFFSPYLEWAVPQPHNIFLSFWLQTGIIGFIGFIWLMYYIFSTTWKKYSGDLINIHTLVISFFVYFIIHGLVDTTYWKNDLALIFWFFVGIFAVINKKD